MSTYIICQEMFGSRWAVCVYAVAHCERIVVPPVELSGFVKINGETHYFKMASFANDSDFSNTFKEVEEWVEEDNAEIEEQEAKNAKHAAK